MVTVPENGETACKQIPGHTPIDTDNGNFTHGNLEVGSAVKLEIGDAFKTGSVWEKAVALHERGITWSQVASELISACER